MAIELLEDIKKDLQKQDDTVANARRLIRVLKTAGQDTTELEVKVNDIDRKRKKLLAAINEEG